MRHRQSSVMSDTHIPVRSIGAAARGVGGGPPRPPRCCAMTATLMTSATATKEMVRTMAYVCPPAVGLPGIDWRRHRIDRRPLRRRRAFGDPFPDLGIHRRGARRNHVEGNLVLSGEVSNPWIRSRQIVRHLGD